MRSDRERLLDIAEAITQIERYARLVTKIHNLLQQGDIS
jgi:hypothetical protein